MVPNHNRDPNLFSPLRASYLRGRSSANIIMFALIKLRYFLLATIIFSLCSCNANKTTRPAALSVTPSHTISAERVMSDENSAVTKAIDTHKIIKTSSAEKEDAMEQPSEAPLKIDYVLGPEDLVEIDIYQVDELKRTVRISSSGYIKLPLAGKIKASGLTTSELEEEIEQRLERYLQEPVVSASVREFRSQRVTVIGAVKKPQVHIVTQQKFLLDMLSLSEGLTEDAGDICIVQRGDETIVVNINDLLVNGKTQLNIPIFAGDTIHVPKGGIVFVDGSVNAPGSFMMNGEMTITQVIAMAKGMQYEADRNDLKIYRETGSEAREIIDVDYDEILSQKTEDIVLKNKDIVIVPDSEARRFYKGFVRTLGGLIKFGNVSVGAGAL
jgi:polysaccharide export outer membrane protein